jgi:hypothetical protein
MFGPQVIAGGGERQYKGFIPPRRCRVFSDGFMPRPAAFAFVAFAMLAPVALGQPGPQPRIELAPKETVLRLVGPDAGRQLLITLAAGDGTETDATRSAKIVVQPPSLAVVSPTGYLLAKADGKGIVRVQAEGEELTISLEVAGIASPPAVRFVADVAPLFTRFGCNSGGCHGKSGGQNGFALSLLGFEPLEDFEYVAKEGRGRRIFAASPENSLLLRKAAGHMPHQGGTKIRPDSAGYRTLHRWLAEGAQPPEVGESPVTGIEVYPNERTLPCQSTQQLAVLARFADGSIRDVTRLAQYESNEPDAATVDEDGFVRTGDRPGFAAIMVRYQGHVGVFRATVPRATQAPPVPIAGSFIDRLVAAQWNRLGLRPSGLCDDGAFLRRVTIDLAGRLPTLEETRSFLADTATDKRSQAIDRLIESDDFADYFAGKWSAILRNRRNAPKEDPNPTFAFHAWIRESIRKNKPFDQFVREIITATGEEVKNPPVAWYREVRDIASQTEDVAQLFLGTRLQCARCHHHPQEKWSQQDYYGLSAFFSRLEYKAPEKAEGKKGNAKNAKNAKIPTEVFHKEGRATALNPRSNLPVKPTLLGGSSLDMEPALDPRQKLADWVVSKENPYFARTFANRTWKHFLGRGLVEPEDDLRATNPPSNPALLEALAKHFVENNCDMKSLIRAICNSKAYQLSSESTEANRGDRQNYSHFIPRRLHSEVLFDAIDQVTLTKPQFASVPAGTRAVQLPDNAFESYFLTLFGRPDATSACECERSNEVNLAQILHLMNSREILAKVSGTAAAGKVAPKGRNAPAATKVVPGERIAKLMADKRSHEKKLRELYVVAYSREPTAPELEILKQHLESRQSNLRSAYEDVLWAIVNSEEFLSNR